MINKKFGTDSKIPNTSAEAIRLLSELANPEAENALCFAVEATNGSEVRAVASLMQGNERLILLLLLELVGAPSFKSFGYLEGILNLEQCRTMQSVLAPVDASTNGAKFDELQKVLAWAERAAFVVLNEKALDATQERAFLEYRTNTVFELFNSGALRGSQSKARELLLESFKVLPNRYLSSSGAFMDLTGGGERFVAGIDKFPSLMSVRGEELMQTGNRIVPGAMIRNGVYVGNRNIFMFHAAVNIAAYIGDDNLIDSHASVGSAAQLGNKNKLGSFVSLEGVLSPANAEGVVIGNSNFIGSFSRIGAGIIVGDNNFIGSGVNISLGTKLKDCRSSASAKGEYCTPRDLNAQFNNLCIVPNNAKRTFQSVELLPGEYALFENTEEFMGRFEGDQRIRNM